MSRGFGATFGVGATDNVLSSYTGGIVTTISISLWLNINGLGGGNLGRVIDQYNAASVGTGVAFYSGAAYTFQVTVGGTGANTWTIVAPSSSVWHHVLITYDGSVSSTTTPVIYLDGVSVTVSGVGLPGGAVTNLTGNWYIGNRQSVNRNFDGMIADVAIWNPRYLGNGEALALASGVSPLLIAPESLKTYLPLDGVGSPEVDFVLGTSNSITGTKLGTKDPPIMRNWRRTRAYDHEGASTAAAYAPILARGFTRMPSSAREWTGING